jgi:hypothetical protein
LNHFVTSATGKCCPDGLRRTLRVLRVADLLVSVLLGRFESYDHRQ